MGAVTRVLARELRPRDVTVNTVELWSAKQGHHNMAVDLVAFLASDAGHRLTGQVIRIAVV